MIGVVTAFGEAVVSLTVVGTSGQDIQLQTIIDTGYNGELTLPPDTVRGLSLQFAGYREAMLADGSEVSLGLYEAWVNWHGRTRSVEVLEADGDPLAGMSLLWGSELRLQARPNGEVTIEEF